MTRVHSLVLGSWKGGVHKRTLEPWAAADGHASNQVKLVSLKKGPDQKVTRPSPGHMLLHHQSSSKHLMFYCRWSAHST